MAGRLADTSPFRIRRGCFEGSPEEVRSVRAWVRDELRDYSSDTVDTAELCVSELASNAVEHTRSNWIAGCIWVAIEFYEQHIKICVRDNGSEETPTVDDPDWGAETGRGLALVQTLTGGTLAHKGNYLGREVSFILDAKLQD